MLDGGKVVRASSCCCCRCCCCCCCDVARAACPSRDVAPWETFSSPEMSDKQKNRCRYIKRTIALETIRKPPFIKAQTVLKTKNKKYGEKRLSTKWMELLHPAMWHDHDIDFARWLHPAMWHSFGIMTVNSLSGSTMQCDTWLWHDMPWNSPKRPPYWNSTSGFDFDHITQSTCHYAPVCKNFIQIGPPSAPKKLRYANFQDGGSQPSWILGVCQVVSGCCKSQEWITDDGG